MDETGDNNLSFIETSALDASNVELAFQNILTGKLFVVEKGRGTKFIPRNLPNRIQQSARPRRRSEEQPTRHNQDRDRTYQGS